jgi:carboxymethylenebutenolidase
MPNLKLQSNYKMNKTIMLKAVLLFITIIVINESALSQDYALRQLEESPRHHEWVSVTYNGRTVHSFVAYPEVSENVLTVIVIHENRGLTDWVRSFADQVAEAGYIAIAPDLLSQFDENHQRTRDFANDDAARDALYQLDPDQITSDLLAVQEYIATVPGANGQVVVSGFCWGGSQSFRFVTNASGLSAALVFYGSATTDEERIRNITAPVYGFYGGNDQRINATIPETESMMNKHGKFFDYKIYEGAGHGYMRTGDDPDGTEANIIARNKTWEWLHEILDEL